MIYLVQATDFAGMTYAQTAFLIRDHANAHALKQIAEGFRVNMIEVELGDKDVCISSGILGNLDSVNLGHAGARQN